MNVTQGVEDTELLRFDLSIIAQELPRWKKANPQHPKECHPTAGVLPKYVTITCSGSRSWASRPSEDVYRSICPEDGHFHSMFRPPSYLGAIQQMACYEVRPSLELSSYGCGCCRFCFQTERTQYPYRFIQEVSHALQESTSITWVL
jgi:hypothetical protein